MANRKHTLIKSMLIVLGLGLATLAAPAQAHVWQTPYGQLMSNTCISNDGTFMNFSNQAGPVGAPCQFFFYGMPGAHFGYFG